MVLNHPVTNEEQKRHLNLINNYFTEIQHQDSIDAVLYDYGAHKGVYKVSVGDKSFLAAAASKDLSEELLTEYNRLHDLYDNSPNFFPKPVAHYRDHDNELGDLLVMEFLSHQPLNLFRRDNSLGVSRDLAYQIGSAVAEVNLKTGRFSSEPHDGNILAKLEEDNLEVKFVDAIQFLEGDLEDTGRAILINKHERPECYRFIHRFREGMADALKSGVGLSQKEAYAKLEFMREYNDIF